MSIQSAIDFLAKVQQDDNFRKCCYAYRTQSDLLEYLDEQGFRFDALDMENAVNHLLLRCTEESQAYTVRHLQSWFNLFSE